MTPLEYFSTGPRARCFDCDTIIDPMSPRFSMITATEQGNRRVYLCETCGASRVNAESGGTPPARAKAPPAAPSEPARVPASPEGPEAPAAPPRKANGNGAPPADPSASRESTVETEHTGDGARVTLRSPYGRVEVSLSSARRPTETEDDLLDRVARAVRRKFEEEVERTP
jgi:hypothetical protein